MSVNKPDWVSIGSVADFIADSPKIKIDPQIDWFISSLLANYENYNLDNTTRSQMIFFVYLLLNTHFQHFLLRLRDLMEIPNNGFLKKTDFDTWASNLNTSSLKTLSNKPLNFTNTRILLFLKQKIGRPIETLNEDDRSEDPADELLHVLVKALKIPNPYYSQWLTFLKNILFLPDPKQFLNTLSHHRERERVAFRQYSLTITLNRHSSINSIKTTIEANKHEIRKVIKGLKIESKETSLENENLVRDYNTYKNYISHNAGRGRNFDIHFNKRKEEYATDKVEQGTGIDIGNIDFDSIRKLVSRMNKRIESTMTDRLDTFNALLSEIEQISS